jgi:hypothetical protein
MALCDECPRDDTLLCSRCKASQYCTKGDKKCQKKAWKYHKHLYQTFKDFQDRPTSKYKNVGYSRAIYFHPEEESPRFLWLEWMKYTDPSCHGELNFKVKDLLYNNDEEAKSETFIVPERYRIHMDKVVERRLEFTILLGHRNEFLYDGSKPNKAIANVIDRSSKYLAPWNGPVIAYGAQFHKKFNHIPETSFDLGPSDIGRIVHELNWQTYKGTQWQLTKEMVDAETIKAKFPKSDPRGKDRGTVGVVRLNCDGDVRIEKRPMCEGSEISAAHPIFYPPLVRSISPLSEHLELPLVVIEMPGSRDYWPAVEADYGANLTENDAATFLLLSCDPKNQESFIGYAWSSMAAGCKTGLGTMIVARKDKKPLLVAHLAALIQYCQYHLASLFLDYSETESIGQDGDNKVLQEITKAKFEKHWNSWKTTQANKSARELPSPYSM